MNPVMLKTSLLTTTPLTYTYDIADEDDRLDCAWSNPATRKRIDDILSRRKKKVEKTSLHKIAKVKGGKRLPSGTLFLSEFEDTIPYIRVGDVTDMEVNISHAARISKTTHKIIQNYQLLENDIVLTIVGATIGKNGILKGDNGTVNFTENLARIRLYDSSVDPLFLLQCLNSELVQIQVERLQVGALQYKLSLENTGNIQILLPTKDSIYDLSYQKSVLEKLNESLEQQTKLRLESISLIEEAQAFIQSTLNLPPEATHETDMQYTTMLDPSEADRLDFLYLNPFRERLIKTLKQHPHAKLIDLLKPVPQSKIPFRDFYQVVDQEQVDDRTGRITEAKEVPFLGSSKRLLKSNSIIISKMQSRYGKVALVSNQEDGYVASSEFLQYSSRSADVNLKYVWVALRSAYALLQWKYSVTGASRMRIGPKEIGETIIPLPPKEVQRRIVDTVESKIKKSDELLFAADEFGRKAALYLTDALQS